MKISELLLSLSENIKIPAEVEQIIEWTLLQSTGRSWRRSEWMVELDREISQSHADQAVKLAEQRAKGIPLQYLTQEQSFYGRSFYIEKGVLVPRPETEILVDEVLKKLNPSQPRVGFELGLGAGPIAITLLAERPHLRMIGTEVSDVAINVTLANTKKLLSDPLRLEIVSEIKPIKYDFIVSNPPYLLKSTQEVDADVMKYEPELALFAPENEPLYFYKHLKELAIENLKPDGFLALEIPHERAESIRELFTNSQWRELEIIPDLNSHPRVLVVTLRA